MAEEAITHAGHGGHLGDTLSDAHGEGVHHSAGVAHAGTEGHNGHTHYCIEAHGHGDAGKYGDEGEPLLHQTNGGGGDTHDEHEDGDDGHAGLALEHLQQAGNQTVERTAGNDDVDGGVRDEHKEGDRPGIAHAVIDGLEHLEDTDRRLLHRVEGAGHGYGTACGLVHHPVKLAGGEDPGEDGADNDDGKQQNIDVRQLDAFFLF